MSSASRRRRRTSRPVSYTIAIGLETPADPKLPKRRDRLDNPTSTNPWVNDPYGGYFNPPPPTNSGGCGRCTVAGRPVCLEIV